MKLFNSITKKVLAGVAVVAAIAGISTVAIAGFGPDRPTKAYSPTMSGFDHPQFNSFTGVPGVGDERDFLRGVSVGRDSQWADPVNSVGQDTEVEAKIYIHNNADIQFNTGSQQGVAKNVVVKATMPTGPQVTKDITATISADNSTPLSIFDTLTITGANGGYFELEPIAGSGKLIASGQVIGSVDVNQLFSAEGVNIGDQQGCFQAVREVTFRLRVKMPHYTVSKLVRLDGQTRADWKESITATPGQMLNYSIEFKNVGLTTLNSVVIVDDMPKGMVVEPSSVMFYDGNFPNGTAFGPDAIQKNGTQINMNIGNVNAGSNAIVTFKAKVPALDALACGANVLDNKGYATPQTFHTIMDVATVTVNKECADQTAYSCTNLTIAKIGDRKIKATVAYNGTPANRVTFKNVELNFGDGSTPLVTTNTTSEHTYAQNGTYKVSAKVTFAVDGTNQTVTSDACVKTVTFTATPNELPQTGGSGTLAMFIISAMVGMFGFRAYALRKN